jgi:hypothetical protein
MKGQSFTEVDFEQRLALYLDNEMSQSDKTAFSAILNSSSELRQRFDSEKRFRSFIRKSYVHKSASDGLKQQIRSRLLPPGGLSQ